MARVTYWRVLRAYHADLYKSWLYWLSGILIFGGFVLPIVCMESFNSYGYSFYVSITSLVLGFILLMLSKFLVLQREVPISLGK